MQPPKAIPARPAVAALFRKLRREVLPGSLGSVFLSIAELTISYILTFIKKAINANFKAEENSKINSTDIFYTIY